MTLRIFGWICVVTIMVGVGHMFAHRRSPIVDQQASPPVSAAPEVTKPENTPAPSPRQQRTAQKVDLSLDSRVFSPAPVQSGSLALTDVPRSRRQSRVDANLSLDAPVAVMAQDTEQPLSDWAQLDADTKVEGAGDQALEIPKYGPAFELPPVKRGR